MFRCWLVVLGVATACGAAPRIHAPGADYLRAIRIEGNHAIETDALAPALALHQVIRDGAAIDPYVLATDTERIRVAYWKRGFFAAKVTARVDRDWHAQIAVFTVIEGRRAATRIEITGLPPELPIAQARALVALRDGAPFDYDVYDAAKHALAARVEDAGYARAEVRSKVAADPVAGLATARYQIVPGERCTFGAIRFTGNVRPALMTAVRARLRFAIGDRYSVSALERSQAEIYEIGRFSTVQLVPDRGGSGPVIDVAVELAEATRNELHAGAGVGYDSGNIDARLRGGYSVVPRWQPAWLAVLTAAIHARGALTIPQDGDTALQPKVRGLVSFQGLDLLRPRLRGEVELGADYQTVEAYTWTGEHVRLGLGSPLGSRSLQLRVGWMLEHVQFGELDAALDSSQAPGCPATPPPGCATTAAGCATAAQLLGLCRSQVLGAYQASLVADLRDNPIEPHRGVYLDLRAAAGTPLAGGELTYLQFTPELRGYFSIGELIFAARARAGAIFGDIPVTQRYYSGGASGHGGFRERQLSPTEPSRCSPGMPGMQDPACVVIGGAGLVETGVELRRQLATLWTFPLGANLFLDGGDVTRKPEQLDLQNLYWAAGVGVWGKLVGDLKLRVDFGYRLNRTGSDDPLATRGGRDNLVWLLGIGEGY